MDKQSGFGFLIRLIMTALLASSCSDDLDLITGSNPVPVVYCVLQATDSVYKVMLSKTFSGGQSAYDMAQDTGKVYYQAAQVSLEAWGPDHRYWTTGFHPTTASRESGVFSSLPGFCYESDDILTTLFQDKLSVINNVRLIVKVPGNDNPAYARIGLAVNPPSIWAPSDKIFNICDSVLYHIEFFAEKPQYYELKCKFRYLEFTDCPLPQQRSVDFVIKKNILVSLTGTKYLNITPEGFFMQLAACFPSDTLQINYRTASSLDLEIYVGSKEYKQFIDFYSSDNDHSDTQWNCFHGGIGLFAILDKSTVPNLYMDDITKDSLANGQFTKHLKFSKW